MSCKITIDYPHPKEEAVQKLKEAVENKGGTFEGNTSKGNFKVGTPLGAFEVEYVIKGDSITIDVLKKPLLISCKRIEEEIQKYLENNPIDFKIQPEYDRFIQEYKHDATEERLYDKQIKSMQEDSYKKVRKAMSKHLIALSQFDLKDGDTALRVKKIILNVKGNYSTNPDELPTGLSLKDNLLYNSNEYIMLAIKLNELIPDGKPKITMTEMRKCKTVSDCITLVTSKI